MKPATTRSDDGDESPHTEMHSMNGGSPDVTTSQGGAADSRRYSAWKPHLAPIAHRPAGPSWVPASSQCVRSGGTAAKYHLARFFARSSVIDDAGPCWPLIRRLRLTRDFPKPGPPGMPKMAGNTTCSRCFLPGEGDGDSELTAWLSGWPRLQEVSPCVPNFIYLDSARLPFPASYAWFRSALY